MSPVPAVRCDVCTAHWVPPRAWCPACGGPVEHADAPAAGTVLSWTRVTAVPEGEPRGYVLALVALEDGTRVLARAEPGIAEPRVGARVRVAVEEDARVTWALAEDMSPVR